MNSMLGQKQSLTYIVVLNWNGWQDTIACLESLLTMDAINYRIVVCDNGSTDGSLKALVDWANGGRKTRSPGNILLSHLARQESHAVAHTCFHADSLRSRCSEHDHPIIFLDNGANLGFAAGNNTGIQYALSQPDMTHVWLLNNDTVVEPTTLQNMLARLAKDPGAGCCGSVIKFYDDPTVIQAVGGCSFNSITGIASETLGRYATKVSHEEISHYEKTMDYISGASYLVTRQYLETVGLMEEDYFLYYEEIDWAMRNAGQFRQVIAADAIVYHREGSSIGSASLDRPPSLLSDFYMTRSKLRFMARHKPEFLPVAYLLTLFQALNRFRRGRVKNGWILIQVVFGRKTWTA